MAGPSLKRARALTRAGKTSDALAILREAFRQDELAVIDVEPAGRLIEDILINAPDAGVGYTPVLLLGQYTTSWLQSVVAARAHAHDVMITAQSWSYDNVLQGAAQIADAVAVVVLLPWTQRLLAPDSRNDAERVEDEMKVWRSVWAAAAERGCKIVQAGYDWTGLDVAGPAASARPGGVAARVRAVNAALQRELPVGALFVDLEQLSAQRGRADFYDARHYHWTKQPFSSVGLVDFADHLVAAVRAVLSGPKRVLVVDLDDTLWGGVVGELGPMDIQLGEGAAGAPFTAFQHALKRLNQQGVLLAVASKNNPIDAREPFARNSAMVLTLDDFVAFEASWDSKVDALRSIADQLNLGLDSFVFFDDNPAERLLVGAALPEVAVVNVPAEPADYVDALARGLWFERLPLTSEDTKRTGMYRGNQARQRAKASAQTLDEHLEALQMVGDIRPINAEDLARVVQLIGKTNQWNLTTRRHSVERVKELLARDDTVALTLRLADRFGDHGLVGVLIGVREGLDLRIDTWLMSCRVIGRTAEYYTFNKLLRVAQAVGVRSLVGEYIPTAKNAPVRDLYIRLGFSPGGSTSTVTYLLAVDGAEPHRTFVIGK